MLVRTAPVVYPPSSPPAAVAATSPMSCSPSASRPSSTRNIARRITAHARRFRSSELSAIRIARSTRLSALREIPPCAGGVGVRYRKVAVGRVLARRDVRAGLDEGERLVGELDPEGVVDVSAADALHPPHVAAGGLAHGRLEAQRQANRAGRGRRPRPWSSTVSKPSGPAVVRVGDVEVGRASRGPDRTRAAAAPCPAASPSGENVTQLGQVLAVHRQQQVEVLEVARGGPGARRPAALTPRTRGGLGGRAHGRARRPCARSPCPRCRSRTRARGRPRARGERMTPSAVGERQMLPMQMKRMRFSSAARRSSPCPCRRRRTWSRPRRPVSRRSPLSSVVMIRAPVIPNG